ncbi:MAG TPA: FKBP-type peptidyl-prolyl cis-trans isomerase [Saprospiraceae bacterium]|nr:FKBP-type peptidyl-prolyl cis-trans isomerase [Saprospiraceae bacterium]
MKNSFFLILVMTLLLSACQSNNSSNQGDTSANAAGPNPAEVAEHELEIIGNGEGRHPNIGDEVTFVQKVFQNDEQLGNPVNRNFAQVAVLPHDSTLMRPINPSYAAMFKMGVGDSAFIKQPASGLDSLPPGVKMEDVFTYEINLLRVRTQEEVESDAEALMGKRESIENQTQTFISDFTAGRLDQKLQETENGIKYLMHEKGEGKLPVPGQPVFISYMGYTMDGKSFDDTFQLGETVNFPLGEGKMVPGFEEIIQHLPKGSEATVVIPSAQAYGSTGKGNFIPPDADLVFYIEVLNI